ncbi:hypothetical protein BLNAU_1400 [Blattamonas nauphoetae]|uniref:Uncharacterized protein n=1 Tax=Blattamonas nauphoetae TaxID=2049346 RepID=A0ABQ9YJL0_9EUKA|nr:hypothetical protein BLNAU_1400 [Blattamonas nauphoetae]
MTTLDVLSVVASETDWGLNVVLKHAPIHSIEQLCKKMPLSNCPVCSSFRDRSSALSPKTAAADWCGMSSEDENVRICESSIPSSLLVRFVPNRNEHVRTAIGKCLLLMTSTPRSSSAFLSRHEASFRATLEEIEDSGLSQLFLESLAAIMFSPNTTVIALVCQSLDRHARRRVIAASFLARHTLLFTLAGPPENPIMFTERLIETLSDHLSRLHSLLADSTTQPNMLVEESTFEHICRLTDFVVCGRSLLGHESHHEHRTESGITQTMVSIFKVCLNLIKSSTIPTHTSSPLEESHTMRPHDVWVLVTSRISFFDSLHLPDAAFAGLFVSAVDIGLHAMKDLVSSSTPLSDATVTALRHILEIVSSGLGSLFRRLDKSATHFQQVCLVSLSFSSKVLILQKIIPLVKAAIPTCLELHSHVANTPANQQEGLNATINSALTMSWKIITRSLDTSMYVLHPAVESAFSNGSDMFSLIERTSQQLNMNLLMSLLSLTNERLSSLRTVSIFLKETMIERVLTRVQPTTVPLADRTFHNHIVSLISDMTSDTVPFSWRSEARPSEPLLHFNRVVVPAKRYLMFVSQRDEYVNDPSDAFVRQLNQILKYIILLEKELYYKGMIVETGREEWEVGWLVEMTNKEGLGERLHSMEEDEEMRMYGKKRWKKRAERLRQAGLDDALEARLTPHETYYFLLRLNSASGMNHVNLAFQRYHYLF